MGIHLGLILASCLVTGCAKDTERVPSTPEEAPWPERAAAYEEVLTAHREAGWLVVRKADGTYRDEGDSLTWSGEAMGVSCAQAAATLVALEHMQDTHGGYYVRVEPLPERYVADRNVVSRDGWISVSYGMTRSWHRCPDLRERMAASWRRARSAVGGSAILHPEALSAVITPWFRYFMDQTTTFMEGETPRPSDLARTAFELALEATVRSTVGARGACYPLRLGFLEVLALAAMGAPISDAAKRDLCEATATTGLVNWRWYCQDETAGVASWLEQYQPNKIVYAHQRCVWEAEEFAPDETAASLDWLTLRDLYVNGG